MSTGSDGTHEEPSWAHNPSTLAPIYTHPMQQRGPQWDSRHGEPCNQTLYSQLLLSYILQHWGCRRNSDCRMLSQSH